MQPISYARHPFPPEVIRHAVWLYLRFTLSCLGRDLIAAEVPCQRSRSDLGVYVEFQVLAIIGGQCSKLSSPVQSHHARRL
jgi:hypothetical protein